MSCVLGMDQITPQYLRSRLPHLDFQQCAIIASHNDGRWAVYVGNSTNLPERIKRKDYHGRTFNIITRVIFFAVSSHPILPADNLLTRRSLVNQ